MSGRYRLAVQLQDTTLRFALDPGENLVGSASDCAVRIRHPSVSRHHAMIKVRDDVVELSDLGSRNGIYHLSHKVKKAQPKSGEEISFGAVHARIEAIAEDDLEPAVVFDPQHTDTQETGNLTNPATTLSSGLADRFTMQHLPEIAARLAGGADLQETAEQVGHALVSSLPLESLLVSTEDSESSEGVLFISGESIGEVDPNLVISTDCEGYRVRAVFPSPRMADAFKPVVQAAVRLVAASERPSTASGRTTTRSTGLTPPPLPEPPTVSPAIQTIYSDAARIARSDISVLVLGESGTGKEVLARYLHHASGLPEDKMLCLNCAALPRDLLESELFGIEKGVATGIDPRPGLFEMADGGTLFLDEIGDMAPETQARILRVLQSGEVYRLGGRQAKKIRVRFVAATNRDIASLVSDGSFRSDLYHRIAGWVIELPPLRDRAVDIPNLAAHFLSRAGKRAGVRLRGISRRALDTLTAYHWPGNIRELRTEMERAVLFLEDNELLDSVRLNPTLAKVDPDSKPASLEEQIRRAEKKIISRVCQAASSVDEAAARLDISRATLYRHLKALDLEREDHFPGARSTLSNDSD